MAEETWPVLPYAAWTGTRDALHLWCQIVGKVRLAQTPWLNHSWQTPFYVTPRGLSTGLIPHGARALDIEFDFVDHRLRVRTDAGGAELQLQSMPVADFHAWLMDALRTLGVPVTILAAPSELPDPIPFDQDRAVRPYDPVYANRFWRVLLGSSRVMGVFRTGFLGKASPVHFFWGGFDLAVTRFSGRRAPPHPGGIPHLPDEVTREAYSHEVSSAGFWPGGPGAEEAVFYAYAYPEPPGFRDAAVAPSQTRFDAGLGEFLLPYEAVRASADPDAVLMQFLTSTYAAAANAAAWDRQALECDFGLPGRPRPA